MFSYFTIAAANEKLPIVVDKFKNIIKLKNEIVKIEQYVTIKQKLNSAVTKFYQAIEDLENTGVVIKGIDDGLLDFPSKRFDDEVWLCWKEGEKEIKFWHEKDVGFSGRKPISVSDESLI